jgi:hypothetical protein
VLFGIAASSLATADQTSGFPESGLNFSAFVACNSGRISIPICFDRFSDQLVLAAKTLSNDLSSFILNANEEYFEKGKGINDKLENFNNFEILFDISLEKFSSDNKEIIFNQAIN